MCFSSEMVYLYECFGVFLIVSVSVCGCVLTCLCVCVCERERSRDKMKGKEGETVVCVCCPQMLKGVVGETGTTVQVTNWVV